MCNTHKRYRGCKPTPDIVQRIPDNFHEYVIGFCRNQEHRRVLDCTACGGISLCEKTVITESYVRGIFVCVNCGYEKEMRVGMSELLEKYNELKRK